MRRSEPTQGGKEVKAELVMQPLATSAWKYLKSFWKQEVWGPLQFAGGLGSFVVISAGTFPPKQNKSFGGSQRVSGHGWVTHPNVDFPGERTAQRVSVLPPDMNSSSRGPPSERPRSGRYLKLFNLRETISIHPCFAFAVLRNSWDEPSELSLLNPSCPQRVPLLVRRLTDVSRNLFRPTWFQTLLT